MFRWLVPWCSLSKGECLRKQIFLVLEFGESSGKGEEFSNEFLPEEQRILLYVVVQTIACVRGIFFVEKEIKISKINKSCFDLLFLQQNKKKI
jgi:hypothetical protein